jgi:hypothetical protein
MKCLNVVWPPGHPGIPPTWASGAKNGVGTSPDMVHYLPGHRQ